MMDGDRVGEMIWLGIRAKARGFIADWWPIGFSLICMGLALYIAGSVE